MRKYITKKEVKLPAPAKKVGRPKGATNKVVKEEAEKIPDGFTTATLKATQVYNDRVIFEHSGETFSMPLSDFAAAVLTSGYSQTTGFTIPVVLHNKVARYYPRGLKSAKKD